MTQEEKQLLLKDLCARLPYGVKCADFRYDENGNRIDTVDTLETIIPNRKIYKYENIYTTHDISRIKPYLRPMLSMTEEEKKEYYAFLNSAEYIDWLNARHFDYRDLIEKGLALEAPEGMYN